MYIYDTHARTICRKKNKCKNRGKRNVEYIGHSSIDQQILSLFLFQIGYVLRNYRALFFHMETIDQAKFNESIIIL